MERNYNILINSLSTVNLNKSRYWINLDRQDTSNKKHDFEGYYTNEVITHTLIRDFANEEKGEKIDQILSLKTKTVCEGKLRWGKPEEQEQKQDLVRAYLAINGVEITREEVNELTHYGFYQQVIKKWIAEEYSLDSKEAIREKMPKMPENLGKIPDVAEADDIYRAVLEMAKTAIRLYNEHTREGEERCCIYMDYMGGDRSAAIILIALTKMLEERGICVDHILAINYDPNKIHGEAGELLGRGEIRDKTEVNYIFDFISGMQEFRNYGRANILNRFLAESQDKHILVLSDQEKKIQEKISSLADAIQLCRSNKMRDQIGQLVNAIDEYEKKQENVGSNIFEYLIEDIKNNYSSIYKPDQRTIPNIIRWALNKNLIQQAVTMYAELLPEVIVKGTSGSGTGILYYDKEGWNRKKDNGVYENEVHNYWINGSLDGPRMSGKSKEKYSEEYAYINYYIWNEVGDKAWDKYKKENDKNWKDKYDICKRARTIAKYICGMNNFQRSQERQRNYIKTKTGLTPDKLENLLKNYMLLKKIRHELNHASKNNIKIRDYIRDMKWRNITYIEESCVGEKNEMTVKMLMIMMGDLLDQLDEILSK